MPEIGVIGGSGLYRMDELKNVRELKIDTPYGDPSDLFRIGEIEGREVAFLARHGRHHRLDPSHLPFRANIFAFKKLGVRRLISASAVGSLREEIAPLHMVVPDQFFDRTRGRCSSFYGDGVVAHVAFADPLCQGLRELLQRSATGQGVRVHEGGTYVCMEGPAFSTRAESLTYRNTIHGAAVIGMTNLQEAKLSREAEICYATLALVTDYDCWHEGEDDVTTEAVIEILQQNAQAARAVIREAVRGVDLERSCDCERALSTALLTPIDAISEADRMHLSVLLGRLVGPSSPDQ